MREREATLLPDPLGGPGLVTVLLAVAVHCATGELVRPEGGGIGVWST